MTKNDNAFLDAARDDIEDYASSIGPQAHWEKIELLYRICTNLEQAIRTLADAPYRGRWRPFSDD